MGGYKTDVNVVIGITIFLGTKTQREITHKKTTRTQTAPENATWTRYKYSNAKTQFFSSSSTPLPDEHKPQQTELPIFLKQYYTLETCTVPGAGISPIRLPFLYFHITNFCRVPLGPPNHKRDLTRKDF